MVLSSYNGEMENSDKKAMETEFHVRYAETDAMWVVHHSTYLVYFEEGRSQLVRDLGCNYADVEAAGYRMPVTEISVRYVGSLFYGEKVKVHTRIEENLSRRITFSYEVTNPDNGEKLVSGFTKHIWTDKDGKVTRMPEQWAKLFHDKGA